MPNASDIKTKIDLIRANTQGVNAKDNLSRADWYRTPFQMDCVSWQKEGRKIVFRCNPEDVHMSWPQRGSTQDVKVGKVFYWFRNPLKKSHYQTPIFTFTFQTGNIVPIRTNSSNVEEPLYIPSGVDNFLEFMSLHDEVKILADGTPNFIRINHHSALFPNLTLIGFFDATKDIAIKETAGDSVIKWEGTFFCHDSIPSFNSSSWHTTFRTYFTNR